MASPRGVPTRSPALDVVLGCLGALIGMAALALGVTYRSWPGLLLALIFLAAAVVLFRRAQGSARGRRDAAQTGSRNRRGRS